MSRNHRFWTTTPPRQTASVLLAAGAALLSALAAPACRSGKAPPADTPPKPPDAVTRNVPDPEPAPEPVPDPPLQVEADDPDRWVFAEKVRDSADGGWITGSFDPKRNKVEIQTRDVTRFALHTDRIPIDWERLVVISIDGRNAELRRRDSDVLHFQIDRHGRWMVLDP